MFNLEKEWNKAFVKKFGGETHMKQKFPKLYSSYMNTLTALESGEYNANTIIEKDIVEYLVYYTPDKRLYAEGCIMFNNLSSEIQGTLSLEIKVKGGEKIIEKYIPYSTKNSVVYEISSDQINDIKKYKGKTFQVILTNSLSEYKNVVYTSSTPTIGEFTYSAVTNDNINSITLEHPAKKVDTSRYKISSNYHCRLASVSAKSTNTYDYDHSGVASILDKANQDGLFMNFKGTALFNNPNFAFRYVSDITACRIDRDPQTGSTVSAVYEDIEGLMDSFEAIPGGFKWSISKNVTEGKTKTYYESIQWNKRIPKEFFNGEYKIEFTFAANIYYKDPAIDELQSQQILIYSVPAGTSQASWEIPQFYYFSGCFPKSVNIMITEGQDKREKQIQDIVEGDMVITSNGQVRKVKHTYIGQVPQTVYVIKVKGSDRYLKVTETHIIKAQRGAIPAYMLNFSDKIETANGIFAEIETLYTEQGNDFYNIELETDSKERGSFIIAEGLVVGDVQKLAEKISEEKQPDEWDAIAEYLSGSR